MVHAEGDFPARPRLVTLPRIDIDLACRSCGYDLRGIAADGRCPECGAPALQSVLDHTDETAASLPPLDRPAAAGAALATLVASLALGAILPVVQGVVPDLPGGDGARAIAAGSSVTTFLASLVLARRFGSRRRTSRRVLQLAAAGWSVAVLAWWRWPSLPVGVPMMSAAILIWSLGRPMEDLGRRSVRFLRQGPGRQRIGALAGSAAIAGITGSAQWLLGDRLGPFSSDWVYAISVIERIAGGLTCLGLVYLTANSMVIARSLGEPAIDPRHLLGHPLGHRPGHRPGQANSDPNSDPTRSS